MIAIQLLDHFDVTRSGVTIRIPSSAHRVVALLALQDRPVDRSYISRCLWMSKSEDRAHANLRSALWRLRQCPTPLVSASSSHLALVPDVEVDVHALRRLARALVDESKVVDVTEVDVQNLAGELLPHWSDDFVEIERERLRQIRLHALETLARRLLQRSHHARALDAALTAVSADPLRESAHRLVIEVHLAEGNVGAALRQYHWLVDLLSRELDMAPSKRTADLIVAETTQREMELRHMRLPTLQRSTAAEAYLSASAPA